MKKRFLKLERTVCYQRFPGREPYIKAGQRTKDVKTGEGVGGWRARKRTRKGRKTCLLIQLSIHAYLGLVLI